VITAESNLLKKYTIGLELLITCKLLYLELPILNEKGSQNSSKTSAKDSYGLGAGLVVPR
jgi:hypothetical protein